MNRLNELADELTVIRGAIGNVGRHWSAEAVKVIEQTESLLRAAAAETVGTEWGFKEHDSQHNCEMDAARLAVAAARRERDAKQRAIDEADFAVRLCSDGTANIVTKILGPHATRREGTKSERKWSSTPPQDRGGKWWNAWKNTDGSHGKWLVPLNIDWRDALDQRGTAYDLWLPYLDGDTRDNLPPLPNSSAVVTGSPAPEIAAVVCKQCGSECGDQRYRAPELRGLCDACICGDTPGPADDTRELVARLAECIMDRMEPLPDGMRTDLVAIYRDARRGGGA